jgi:MFS family permease
MFSNEMRQTLILAWPLFMGLCMIMMGNGLQGTLLGLRASLEGFPVFVTGLVMSLYYAGFLIGCHLTPKMVASVGHIRVFAALASIASATILLHGVFVDPWVWGIVRIFSGISFAGLFIVTESWLNSISTNKLRGMTFGIYLFVLHGSLFIGQFLINLAPLDDIGLFVLISILVSLSLLPLTLANKPAPGFTAPEKLPLKTLMKSSPLSLYSVFVSGFCAGTIFAVGAVYASELGKSNAWTAYFMACYVLGSAIIPLVLGAFSDKRDRRKVIIGIAFVGFIVSLLFNFPAFVFPVMILFGGIITSIYSIGLAYMNDYIKPEQMVSASTSLILLNSIGAMLGPLISGFLMDFISLSAFYYGFSVILLSLFLFGLYRARYGNKVVIRDQGEFVPVPTRTTPGIILMTENSDETDVTSDGK